MSHPSDLDDDDDDLGEFHVVFFDEADEHLAGMESLLLGISVAGPDAEELNAIFRAAHSIKGGAAVFGFTDMAALTHEMETVFDRVRKGTMPLSTALVDVFLAAGDTLKGMVSARRGLGDAVPADVVEALCVRLRGFLSTDAAPARVETDAQAGTVALVPAATVPTGAPHTLDVHLGPFDGADADDRLDRLLVDLTGFGAITPADVVRTSGRRHVLLTTTDPIDDIVDALAFCCDPALVRLSIRDASGAPVAPPVPTAAAAEASALDSPIATPPPSTTSKAQPPKTAANDDASSIRVSVQKVDQLINLVGELVITQAMLAQSASKADSALYQSLLDGLAQLQRNTRDLQEAAMSIRMMPMSFAFSRFPRMVRDVAAKLGKDVDLHLSGESTELDKGLIERIVDPLTHLVRNSLDHGLETPDERRAAGKSPRGTITMRAFHQGGAIVIEVSDDGRGLSRERILAKARERGLAVSDAMSDQDVWALIFEAGFSTAEQVTDVSGRGVGMDVVRRNIEEMGGRVEIESATGGGTRMRIKLPLTLAILEGMSVRLGDDLFILPLSYISESLQPAAGAVSTVGGVRKVIRVRGEYLPVVSLAEVLAIPSDGRRHEDGIIVILDADGEKTALFVDDLVGQHQVVIKSLETNYRKVAGISGATIMGDGRVAMILDVPYLVGLSHSRLAKAA